MKLRLPFLKGNLTLIAKPEKKSLAIALAFFFFISINGFAQISAPVGGISPLHSVSLYSATCGSGPQYSIQPTVASVNSTSNYRWQYKNTAGTWVCISPGANNIGGSTYNVTGAEYNQTTSPGPLVFTNPNIGLDGLIVRVVIYDGTVLTGCNFPPTVYNGDASSINHTIAVAGTACGSNSSCLVGGINMGALSNYLFVFTNGSTDANWQSASKGFIGNVAVDGIQASERTSGSFAYAGTILSNDASLNAWSSIVSNNSGQAFSSLNQTSLISGLETDLNNTFTQINALTVTSGYNGIAPTALNGLNTTNGIAQTFVININSGFAVSSQINITGDAGDIFILRWDTDMNFGNGYQGQVKFQSGGAIVPLGGLKPSNFIHVAGDIASSGGGSNPASPYPQGPRYNNGTGALITGGADFSGGGFFTGYWFTTGDPANGQTSSLSNGIFVGGWYSSTNKFSMTSGTSGVYVAPVCGTPPCSAHITSLYFNELNGGPDLPITNGATFTIAQLGSLYNLEAGTSGTVGSVKYTITGPTPTSNIENTIPYNSPGTGSGAWTGAAGNYSINLKAYSAPDAGGSLCHDTTITFILTTTYTLGDRVWYDANNNGINDATENGIKNVTVNLYLDANNDNVPDGAAIATTTTDANGYYQFTGLSTNNYIVGVIVPNGYMSSSVNGGDPDNNTDLDDNGQVLNGNEIRGLSITLAAGAEPSGGGYTNNTYDFGLLPDCTCTTSAGNLLVNPSFENGTTGWTWSSNASLTTGTGYIACGAANGFNNWNSGGAALVYQDVAVVAGSVVTFNAFAGTHTPGITCSPKLSLIFLNAANTVLGQTDVTVTRDVDVNFSQLEQYSISATAPAGTTKARVQSSITCNTMKIDAFCLTVAATCPGGGTWNLNLPGGTLGTSQAYTVNGKTITAYGFNNGNPGTPTALYGKNGGGDENGLGINSNVNFEIDINHFVQLDLNQIIAAGVTSGTMSIGSMQAGEPANVFGSNTLGVQGTLLMTVPVTLDNTSFPIPGFPAYRYISVQASAPTPADVLLQQVSFSCPTLGCLGDRVWKDDNANGIQDPSEIGVAGVTLVLLNAAGQPIATTTTDAFGNYKFCGLPAGNYSVRITPPANYSLSAKTQGSDVNLDSDFDPVSYTTATVTLTAGQTRLDVDAGLKFSQPQPATVGDRVWHDINGDGIQDANEPGVSNVLVTLYNSGGVAVASMYTDANGLYLFTNVAPGNYTVGVSLPPAMVFSPNNGAVSVGNNSDINPANGRTASFTVNAGDQIKYVDAGLKTQLSTNGSVGDFVWNDLNKDGVQDAGEPGIAGVTVRLVDANTNTIIATTVTNAFGKYIFNDVPPGNYQVDFVTPSGHTTTTKLNSNVITSGTDSDVDPGTGRSAIFILGAGERITTVDAGYWVTTPPGTGKIGDRVWHDANQNGIQDAGEPNVSGVTVTLYNSGGTAIKQATTDQNGNYLFTDLGAGNYTVGFSNLPDGFTFTTAGLGTAATGSDANPATGRTATITLAAGQTNLDVDAGIRSAQSGTGSLGNRVWYDLNNNGLQDAGEVGVQGATVELLDAAGNPIDKDPVTPGVQPTVTIANALGEYLFTGLGAGDYKVRFSTLPSGYAVVTKGAGVNRNLDSDGNPLAAGTSTTDVVSLAANEDRLDIDLGIFNPTAPLGVIGDRVWFDSNNNGIQDATEQGVPGVSVSLLNSSGTVIATTVTDKDGLYKFVNLADATYSVQFSNLPAGFNFSGKDLGGNDNLDSDADPVTGKTGTYVITGGNTNLTVDAGIYSTRAALGDYVWFDANSDGIQDASESGIPGVTVILYDASNVAISSAITDQNGWYFFGNLNPGSYTVGFSTTPGKLVFTLKDVVAAGDAADSDVDPSTGKTGTVVLVAGQVNLTVDAGLKPVIPASVGDFVWLDLNRDGIQDAGEPGVPGVIATLYNSANQPIGSAVTDGNGYYLINNVPPGTGYYVQFSNQPDPAAPWTLQNVGGASAANNSKSDATGKTTTFNVADGQNVTNIDAGLYKLINLSGNVWHDANALGDNLVNLTSPIAIPTGLRIYLVNSNTGLIERSTLVNPITGTFSFNNINPLTTYRVYLSSVLYSVGNPESVFPLVPIIPGGWEHTGQKNANPPNSPLGSDGINDGRVTVPVGVNNVININFGIRTKGGDVVQG